ncbi:MAG: hypothetical protein GX569_01665 [Candidatus Riflebacteria bacterium]|nr:hypothetical protein [Candidatus Riflebacteria bacterium]
MLCTLFFEVRLSMGEKDGVRRGRRIEVVAIKVTGRHADLPDTTSAQ